MAAKAAEGTPPVETGPFRVYLAGRLDELYRSVAAEHERLAGCGDGNGSQGPGLAWALPECARLAGVPTAASDVAPWISLSKDEAVEEVTCSTVVILPVVTTPELAQSPQAAQSSKRQARLSDDCELVDMAPFTAVPLSLAEPPEPMVAPPALDAVVPTTSNASAKAKKSRPKARLRFEDDEPAVEERTSASSLQEPVKDRRASSDSTKETLSLPKTGGGGKTSTVAEVIFLPGSTELSDAHRVSAISRNSGRSRKSDVSAKSEAHAFELLDIWMTGRRKKHRKTPPMKGSLSPSMSVVNCMDMDELEDEEDEELSRFLWLVSTVVLHPSSNRRFVWEFSALFLVSYDMVAVPLLIFDPAPSIFTDLMAWIVRLFWTGDVFVSFLTGYTDKKGTVEMRFPQIARRYCKTWLPLDILIIFFNWAEVIDQNIGSGHRSLRFLRIMRLVRLIKASEISRLMSENFRDDRVLAILGVTKILIMIVVTTHFIACMWYGLSQSGVGGPHNWVRTYQLDRFSVFERYLYSFHWAITQFTGPDMEVQPESNLERFFSVTALLFAFVVSACFVSSITTYMTRLELMAETQQAQFLALRRYLSLNSISGKLAARVQRNAKYAIRERTLNVSEEEVELLQLVSDPLRVELHYEIYSPLLKHHPLFRRFNEVSPAAFRKMCHTAVRVRSFHDRDVLFHDAEVPQHPEMFFVISGKMHYLTEDNSPVVVGQGQWLCEASLWIKNWSHIGLLRAVTDVRLLVLDALIFHMTTDQFRSRDFKPEAYANKFVEYLNHEMQYGELTDLCGEDMEWDILLKDAFPKETGEEKEARTTAHSSPRMSTGRLSIF